MPAAFTEPNAEEEDYIMSRMPDVSGLDSTVKAEFDRSMLTVLGDIDTNVRQVTQKIPGIAGQHHYYGIRALITPRRPKGTSKGVQLVGQQYFGINRFFAEFIDIGDIEIWALFDNGDWQLHEWNNHGEHLATGNGGLGALQTGYLKVNGEYLSPHDAISFAETFVKRAKGNFRRVHDPKKIRYAVSQIEHRQKPAERRIAELQELNIISPDLEGTYIWRCTNHPNCEATHKKAYDERLKALRTDPSKLTGDLGPHGSPGWIRDWYNHEHIIDFVSTKEPSFEDVLRLNLYDRACYLAFGFTLSDMHLLRWPRLSEFTDLSSKAAADPYSPGYIERILQKLGI